jgi:amino acid efflux transporter
VLLAGLIYWVHSLVVLKYGLYGDEATNATAIPALLSLLFGPTAKWLVAVLGYLSCFASINIYLQGFARLIWSMARRANCRSPSLASRPGALPCMPLPGCSPSVSSPSP